MSFAGILGHALGQLFFEIMGSAGPEIDLTPREGRQDRTQRLAAQTPATILTETRQQRRAAERAARKGRTA